MSSTKPSLTLIVAATTSNGIGRAGTLPWTGLKKEMAYFARVTKFTGASEAGPMNAVIMGRKTWDSIPTRFRPLAGRINVVISRDTSRVTLEDGASAAKTGAQTVLVASSLADALAQLQARDNEAPRRIFVIGGAEIYKLALARPETDRVLLTRVFGEWACDTFLSVDLEEEVAAGRWTRASFEQLREFTGGNAAEGIQKEGGTDYEFCMYEKGA